jgi:pimeloyl-ACP methyl ester carboxylesterase
MYYEIHGSGRPLVLLHGGGSTILSTFGRILPELAKTHRVIAIELQAHGHTPDIDRPLSFEQDADDVARMLAFEDISDADLQAIQAPALIINGDAEVVRAEHALALSRALPDARLAILPGGHGEYIGEICAANGDSKIPALVTAMIEAFLKEGGNAEK